jgi:hypothetical protein
VGTAGVYCEAPNLDPKNYAPGAEAVLVQKSDLLGLDLVEGWAHCVAIELFPPELIVL